MGLLRDLFPAYAQSTVSASSLRSGLRGEILPITVTTASKRFLVPADWKGRLVRFHVDGGDLYYQISTGADAACDIAARAIETGTPIALTPSASGNGCIGPFASGTWFDIQFPVDANTFALIGSAACVARVHPSET